MLQTNTNITQWLASTVVPFKCLFVVRQDTAELFESCHWGLKQVVWLLLPVVLYKMDSTPVTCPLVCRCKVAQRSTGWSSALRKSETGVSSMLQVVWWAFSVSLYRRRSFIQAWRRRRPELYTWTKEAGAEDQECGIWDPHLLLDVAVRDGCYLTSKQSRYSWARS